ncbi:hypothetical protein PISMIDRAFT_54765, partial [Pisolithus microcarpus 441]
IPLFKRRRLDVPYRVQKQQKMDNRLLNLKTAFEDLDKMLKSAQTKFVGGQNGLQARRCRAIRAHLDLVIRNGRLSSDAAERAAETNGFSRSWGGRQLRGWTRQWVTNRKLPESLRGRHAKTASVLAIPSIKAELRAYLRSNKWSVNPGKLVKFTANEMLPREAEPYLQNLVDNEMPLALKKYLELELFPRIHLKVGHGISLPTARRWLRHEGKNWVFEDEHQLRKKGVGRGIHRSDVICSTVGHLVDAGESLEYGKNYDGYWTGERFCKQMLEKIIPAFEAAHGAGCRALFLIDNSQGHSAYAEDALRVSSRMNINPGGKQARMRKGWFICDGVRIEQDMVYSPEHPHFPDQPKGIKAILTE